MWLRERKPQSAQQLAELADDYSLARHGTGETTSVKDVVSSPGSSKSRESFKGPTQSKPPSKSHLDSGRSQTNSRGEKQCFQCGKWGHLMYSCPNKKELRVRADPKPALQACTDVAWNTEGSKYLRRGTVDGRRVQVLIDTGCDQTMVSARRVQPERVSLGDGVPVLCVHGDTVQYPTTEVEIRIGPWSKRAKVAVAPSLPVDVLLGRDLYCPGVELQPGLGLAVVTRSQARRGFAQGVAQPQVDKGPEDIEARGEELPCELSGDGSDDVETRGEEPPSDQSLGMDGSLVDGLETEEDAWVSSWLRILMC